MWLQVVFCNKQVMENQKKMKYKGMKTEEMEAIVGKQFPFRPTANIEGSSDTFEGEIDKWVAIKCMVNSNKNNQTVDVSERDAHVCKLIMNHSCPYLIRIHEVIMKDQKVFIIMEKGSHDIAKTFDYSFDQKLRYVGHIAQALLYLHQQRVVHRDLKKENVILSYNNVAKLIDYGSAKHYTGLKNGETHFFQLPNNTNISQGLGTEVLNPPEMMIDQIECRTVGASDMWQFALMVIDYLKLGKYEFQECHKHYTDHAAKWVNNPIPSPEPLPKECKYQFEVMIDVHNQNNKGKQVLISMINRCLHYHPDQRITSQEFVDTFYRDVYVGHEVKKHSGEEFIPKDKEDEYIEREMVMTKDKELHISVREEMESCDEGYEPREERELGAFVETCCRQLSSGGGKKADLKEKAMSMWGQKGVELVDHLDKALKEKAF